MDVCPATISGSVVKGSETALSKCAHPAVSTVAAHSTATADLGRRTRMPQGYGSLGVMCHDAPGGSDRGNAHWPVDVPAKSGDLPGLALTLTV